MNPTAPITAGTAGIGQLTCNPADIQGGGTPDAPTLIVPVTIRLNNQPTGSTIALSALEAVLCTSDGPTGTPLGTAVYRDLRLGQPITSVPQGGHDHPVEFTFHLSPATVEQLERRRHRDAGILQFRIRLSGSAEWVHQVLNQVGGAAGQPTVPFEPRYGIIALTAPFWTVQVQDLVFTVEQSTWVDKVLPAVGYDTVRLIEVRLPSGLDGPAAAGFARQLRHLDRRGHIDSLVASRAVMEAWETRLGATKVKPVASVVADAQGWTADDPRRQFFDALWAAAKDLTNATHHEGSRTDVLELGESDARAHLLVTALLCEWLADRAVP